MAKAKPKKAKMLRFKCGRCGKMTEADFAFAGKFAECLACKVRTPVPASQAEADEEAKDYTVNKTFYDIPERCTKCEAKMKKGAVVCMRCGFNYRDGKQLVTEDFTVKDDERLRGKPALAWMVFDFLAMGALFGAMAFRLIAFEKKLWWEQGLYISFGTLFLSFFPMHFMQWWDYKGLPIRDHPYIKEENAAEFEEAANPFGTFWTPLVFLLIMVVGFTVALVAFSRDVAGNFQWPWASTD